ncbi:sterol carrier protein 2-like isoform X1 [Cyprinus carpio]|uniref:Sterol carrier protein 2-like isoform X1 n=1 Tax=Cyprinus carpio TaxID=7962 RepID=A0A9R0B9C1_CYPCA|nr:sterol carrier protein 2-like isoform X1 [Cyprinus carpio]
MGFPQETSSRIAQRLQISRCLQGDREEATGVKDGPGGSEALWVVDAKNGKDSVVSDAGKKADCTISMSDSDLLELMTGQLNPQKVQFNDGLFLVVC